MVADEFERGLGRVAQNRYTPTAKPIWFIQYRSHFGSHVQNVTCIASGQRYAKGADTYTNDRHIPHPDPTYALYSSHIRECTQCGVFA